MINRTGTLFLGLTVGIAFAGDPGAKVSLPSSIPKDSKAIIPERPKNHRWVFGAGLNWRNIGEIEFRTGASPFALPNLFGANSFTPPPGIGASSGALNRSYDDGFVNPDGFTPGLGRTTDYGYASPGQLQGTNLVYTAAGGERRIINQSITPSSSGWSDDREEEFAPYLKLSRLYEIDRHWSIGPSAHFSFTDIEGQRGGLNALRGSERRNIFDVTAIDTFDSSGLVLPAAPYTGAPNIAAPLLPAIPSNRAFVDTLRQTDTAIWNDVISESVEVDLWAFSLGAEAVYQSAQKFYTALAAGLVLNLVDWDARRNNSLVQQVNAGPATVVSTNSARSSGTDVLWGLYVQVAAGYQFTKRFGLEAHVRYDWNESLSETVGASSFNVDLTGYTIGLGGTYTFW